MVESRGPALENKTDSKDAVTTPTRASWRRRRRRRGRRRSRRPVGTC